MQVSLTPTEMAALAAINEKHHSCASLAEALEMSRAKAASIVASLRRKRIPIVSRRDENGWFYDLEATRPDPALRNLIGIGGTGHTDTSVQIDEILAEEAESKQQRRKTVKAV